MQGIPQNYERELWRREGLLPVKNNAIWKSDGGRLAKTQPEGIPGLYNKKERSSDQCERISAGSSINDHWAANKLYIFTVNSVFTAYKALVFTRPKLLELSPFS